MDTEVLSAEAGQLLLTRRQQKQDEDLGPAECREVPCTHRPPGLSPGDSGQEEWPQEGAGLGGAASPQQPRRCPSSCRCLSITHSAPSWPALPGERRPGQAQEPEVSRCPALTQSRPPSSRSPAPSAPRGSSVPARAHLFLLLLWGLACSSTPRPRGLSSREVFEHLEMQPRWEGGAS